MAPGDGARPSSAVGPREAGGATPERKPSQILKELGASPPPPEVPPRRRGRIKRLTARFDRRKARALDDPAWQEQHAWYASVGVSEAAVHRTLNRAERQRRFFEDLLEVRPLARQEIAVQQRRLRAMFQRAQPLIAFMKAESDFFGSLGVDVEDKVKEYRERRQVDPRHRPGEDWLQKPVKELARLFMQHGPSLRRSRTAILRALQLAGHADAVNLEKIRRIIPNRRSVGLPPIE